MLTSPSAYRNLIRPKNAPFELRPASGKGWGAFATENISKDVIVLTEIPVLTIPKCDGHHIEAELERQVANLSGRQRAQLNLLRVDGDKNEKFPTVQAMLCANDFNSQNEDGLHHSHKLQPLASRFNHSCSPNLYQPNCCDECRCEGVRFVAVESISAGTELTFNYGGMIECLTRAERLAGFQLDCHCSVCTASPEERETSDTRRRLIRGVYFLIFGYDLAETHHGKPSVLLVPKESSVRNVEDVIDVEKFVVETEDLVWDSKLRKDAQCFRFPLTSRFIYCALALALMEAEHVLNNDLFRRMKMVMVETLSHVKNPSIKMFLNMAMMKGDHGEGRIGYNWRLRFVEVSGMFGQMDQAGDWTGNAAIKKKMLEYRGDT